MGRTSGEGVGRNRTATGMPSFLEFKILNFTCEISPKRIKSEFLHVKSLILWQKYKSFMKNCFPESKRRTFTCVLRFFRGKESILHVIKVLLKKSQPVRFSKKLFWSGMTLSEFRTVSLRANPELSIFGRVLFVEFAFSDFRPRRFWRNEARPKVESEQGAVKVILKERLGKRNSN